MSPSKQIHASRPPVNRRAVHSGFCRHEETPGIARISTRFSSGIERRISRSFSRGSADPTAVRSFSSSTPASRRRAVSEESALTAPSVNMTGMSRSPSHSGGVAGWASMTVPEPARNMYLDHWTCESGFGSDSGRNCIVPSDGISS